MISINDELEIKRGEEEEMSNDVEENMEESINGDKPIDKMNTVEMLKTISNKVELYDKVASKAIEIKKDLQKQKVSETKEVYKNTDDICISYLCFMFNDIEEVDVAAIFRIVKSIIHKRKGTTGEDLTKAASLITVELIDYLKSSIDIAEED